MIAITTEYSLKAENELIDCFYAINAIYECTTRMIPKQSCGLRNVETDVAIVLIQIKQKITS